MTNTYDHIQTHITKQKSLKIILKSNNGGERGSGEKKKKSRIQSPKDPSALLEINFHTIQEIIRKLYLVQDKNFERANT